MQPQALLDFLTRVGRLRTVPRHCYTAPDRRESVADHSWRLVLMAYLCAEEYPGIDLAKLLTFAAIHDLGEAVTGDIPAFDKTAAQEATEDRAIDALVGTLPEPARSRLAALFDEYEKQETLEAKLCLALDKLEAVHAHNESDIATWLPLEYELNQTYGETQAAFSSYTAALRRVLNAATREKIAAESKPEKETSTMKIQFLGTAHGVPEPDRRCTSVLLTVGERHYLIDAGAPIADELTRVGVAFADINAIFLTHLHGDHINGLVHYLDLGHWYYRDTAPEIFTPSLDLRSAWQAWHTMLDGTPGKAYRFTEIAPGEIYADETIRVTAIPTKHHVVDKPEIKRQSYAFAVEERATGRRILFTGDLRADMSDFPADAFTTGYACIVTEAAHGHLDKLAPLLAQCKTEQLIIAHVSPRANPAERIDALRAALSVPMTVASDGEEFLI